MRLPLVPRAADGWRDPRPPSAPVLSRCVHASPDNITSPLDVETNHDGGLVPLETVGAVIDVRGYHVVFARSVAPSSPGDGARGRASDREPEIAEDFLLLDDPADAELQRLLDAQVELAREWREGQARIEERLRELSEERRASDDKTRSAEALSFVSAARFAGVSTSTVQRWVREARLPALRANGRRPRIRRRDLETLLGLSTPRKTARSGR